MTIFWERAVPLAFHLFCFDFSAVLVVRVPFPFGVWGRMWNSILAVPDHCLFIYFLFVLFSSIWCMVSGYALFMHMTSLIFEPTHEITALFVLNLKARMRSHPVELDVWFLVGPFHTLCVQTVKTLTRLRRCAGSPESLLVIYVIITIISWPGSFRSLELQSSENQYISLHVATK